MKVIWRPQPRQAKFMSRPEFECLYGGAAGGGKSDALLCEALRQIHVPNYKGIIFRKTNPQLTELVDRSYKLYKTACRGAVYNITNKVWKFPSGAQIYFGNMQHEKDKTNYQGKAYDFVGFDELTHFTYDEYMYLFSRCRPTAPGTRCYIRATTNPGGIGHGWVKDRFITIAPAETPVPFVYEVHTPTGETIKIKRKRIFIPSTVFDNKELLKNDPGYLGNLAMMPEKERNALLYGDWDSFSGQVFTEWVNDSKHYEDRRHTHVINPFRIPSYWNVYRSFDFGYAKPFSVGWYAVDPDGKIYRIKEYYGCTGEPNKGLMIDPVEIATNIKRIEKEDPQLKGRNIIGIADPSIFDESRGESVARMMERSPNFIYFSGGDNTRIPGKMQFHYRFAFDENGDCMFQVFNTCKHFIRTIPTLVYDDAHVEDINTDMEDHIYDECRYLLMEHPITPRQNAKKKLPKADPLNLFEDQYKSPVQFYKS